MKQQSTPSKKLITQGLYESGYVRVLFDPMAAGVVAPEYLKGPAQVAFDYGMALPVPIPDLDISDEGIRATLSFDRVPQRTFVPWGAVYCVVSPNFGTVAWPADVPTSVAAESKAAVRGEPGAYPPEAAKPVEPKKARPDWLKSV